MLPNNETPALMEASESEPKAMLESDLRAIYLKKIVEVTITVIAIKMIIINMATPVEFRLHYSILPQTLII